MRLYFHLLTGGTPRELHPPTASVTTAPCHRCVSAKKLQNYRSPLFSFSLLFAALPRRRLSLLNVRRGPAGLFVLLGLLAAPLAVMFSKHSSTCRQALSHPPTPNTAKRYVLCFVVADGLLTWLLSIMGACPSMGTRTSTPSPRHFLLSQYVYNVTAVLCSVGWGCNSGCAAHT